MSQGALAHLKVLDLSRVLAAYGLDYASLPASVRPPSSPSGRPTRALPATRCACNTAPPCGPINDIGQAFADEQVKARGLEVNQALSPVVYAQAAIKSIATVASPLRLSATPPVLHRPPPALGEHTGEVLVELGLAGVV